MWFEGESSPRNIIATLASLITAVDESLSPPAPLWENISSNVGSTLNDDGYVFRSRGSSGKDTILVTLKNAWIGNGAIENSFSAGPTFGVVESYLPNETNGQNGSFSSYKLSELLRLAVNTSWYNINADNYRFKYTLSVTKDRIIITIRTNRPGQGTTYADTATIRNVLYAGLIKRYADEKGSGAVTLLSSYASQNNAYNSARTLKNLQNTGNGLYSFNNGFVVENNRGFGGRLMIAVPMPLYNNVEGVRGELDGVLTTVHKPLDGPTKSTPEDAYVLIDGKEYLCVVKPFFNQWSLSDNFSSRSGVSQALFIEKV
ncbi:hypothetical protein A3844_06120 [Paenibacillus helianthi]|uniref:Uncharacterized protein n=1 Tax=Paenibacillus helianthi TaxID=1349432 RepID=A0ABX3ERQ3_9BACL|nr:hypothetical protein [Paenibacillus helianthi]OKP89555.1 hypothetical protein A3844_06120 [Paenibacillus helianthi]